MSTRQLGMFAKFWEPGQVKTRLASAIGPVPAARLYFSFLRALLRRFDSAADRRVLAYAPSDRRVDFQELAGERWQLEPQASGNLGSRMQRHLEQAIQNGAQRSILIGSDSPTLPLSIIETAFDALAQADVVLGPTPDGGYYLVGIRGDLPPIFAGVEWSTPRVWEQTIGRLEQARCPFHVLPPWYDVDTPEDLECLRRELSALRPLTPELRDLSNVIADL